MRVPHNRITQCHGSAARPRSARARSDETESLRRAMDCSLSPLAIRAFTQQPVEDGRERPFVCDGLWRGSGGGGLPTRSDSRKRPLIPAFSPQAGRRRRSAAPNTIPSPPSRAPFGEIGIRIALASPKGNAMKRPRRQFLQLVLAAAAASALPQSASTLDYPTRPVRVIVPVAPGGGADIVARLTGQWLSERLGQQFIVENRPGGGTNIGTEMVAHAPADGYTLLLVNLTHAINATLYEKLNYNFVRDIAPVGAIIGVSNVVEIHPSVPARSMA